MQTIRSIGNAGGATIFRLALTSLAFGWVLAGCTSDSIDTAGSAGTAASDQGEVRADADADAEAEAEHEEGVVHWSVEQQEAAGIVTAILTPRVLEQALNAPGEIRLNAYATWQVAPRIPAQVVERYARLGDTVATAQALVALSSVEMAEAQGALVVTDREWRRVQGLGRDIVSERRFIEAEVAAQQARARALAYGMTSEQVAELVRNDDASRADGSFTLLSPDAGTVVRDDFVVGESIEAGRLMFEITDESTLWVEARLPVQESAKVSVGDRARVQVDDRWIEGRVIQAFHAVDETTRTLPIRVEIPNPDDSLHPGLFVDVVILDDDSEPVLAVPENAVLRSPDGDWRVFIMIGEDEFSATEIEITRTVAGFSVIEGVEPGARVVTEGAFFLQSELAKSGFDTHAH
jgi:RND family efflux transporter MFP subunit